MRPKRTIAAIGLALALLVAGCGDSGDPGSGNPTSEVSLDEATAPLEGGTPELKEVRDEANQLLGGESPAFEKRLGSLEGTPVVVNNWASWCGPCRAEFPYFQAVAADRGDEIAFLGVDSDDSEDAANTFLAELPLPYPSYSDPDRDISEDFLDNPVGFPATAYYGADGELAYVHQGPYESEDALNADIDKYTQ